MGQAVLHVDHSHHPVARNQWRRKESVVAVLGQVGERLEPRVFVSLARDRYQPAFARHPTRQTLVGPHAQLADGGRVRRIGRAEHQVFAIQQVDQARIAVREFHHQGDNALEHVGQAQVANHETADLLEHAELLFRPLQTQFELFALGHSISLYRRLASGCLGIDPARRLPALMGASFCRIFLLQCKGGTGLNLDHTVGTKSSAMIGDPNHPPPNDIRPTDIPGVFHKSEKLLVALLESASQAILGIDPAGRIVLANRRTLEMFGYTTQELIGAGIELLLPESKRAAHGRQREDYFQRPRVRPMGIGLDLSGRRKDGAEFPVEVSLSTVETEEGIFGIAFISDISLRKGLEAQLLRAQKMEAVGRLAGGVAHDFNNMLTVIAGYNRMILDELSTLDPLRGYAEEILKAADRAGALTNQLLAFSRRQILQLRVINLNAVIGQTENMLRRLIGEDIQLVMSLSADTGNIKADPNHIEQAIVNLAVNGRDAMPLGGRITIETSNTRIDETYAKTHMGVQPGEYVMIAVSDTGHGMDSATRQKIFEPFFTTKPRGKGTGLGLATVYGMVKQSGGDIWVYSEPGQGTTFKLYFPRVAEPASPALIEKPEQPRHDTGETVMLVEDETQVRDLTARTLQRLGYSVLAAANGKEAMDVSRAHPGKISLLVTDVVMPNMSGKQVAEALLSSRPGLRVLYLSGYTENAVVDHGVLD